MPTASPITSEVDLDADGRHAGYLRLPHSVHRSAYGFIPVPILSIRNGDGPKVVIMAGNHGDEYEGQIALAKLAATLAPADVRGQVIILAAANTPAVLAGTRTSPVDGGNLNRSFPGDPAGSPTAVIAHYLESVIFEGINYLLDLHSGGTSLVYLPTALVRVEEDEQANADRRALVAALGVPYALTFASTDGPYATSAATRRGGIAITVELGGGAQVDRSLVALIDAGLRRYLHHVGACPSIDTQPAVHAPRFLRVNGDDQYVYARSQGVFEPVADLGDTIQAGQLAARIHRPEQPWLDPEPVYFEHGGFIVCRRALARTQIGDCLFQVAHD